MIKVSSSKKDGLPTGRFLFPASPRTTRKMRPSTAKKPRLQCVRLVFAWLSGWFSIIGSLLDPF